VSGRSVHKRSSKRYGRGGAHALHCSEESCCGNPGRVAKCNRQDLRQSVVSACAQTWPQRVLRKISHEASELCCQP
jgi:hypothetical protein